MKSFKEYKSKITWETEDPLIREASKIQLEVPSDLDIHEFKIMCIRLASAIGYHEKSIKRAFGDTSESPSTRELSLENLIKTIKTNNNGE